MDLHSQQRMQAPSRPETAQAIHQTTAPHTSRQKKMTTKKLIAAIVAIIVILGLVVAYFLLMNGLSGVKTSQYQAVFLTNGQVYFGKITKYGRDTVAMSDIYYLQQSSGVQSQDNKTDQSQNQLTLTKLGKELHGPEDSMFIERDQIIFWENIKDDSQVVKTIQKEKSPSTQ